MFLTSYTYSQVYIGKVKIDGKPENAIIKLEDSILNRGQIYLWSQGIYKLEISADGYQTFSNSYFQVYKDKLNSYDFKLKKYRERPAKEFRINIPKIIVPSALSGLAALGINYLLFPIEDQSERLDLISNYNAYLLEIESLNYPSWNMTIEEQKNYQEVKSNYLNEVKTYNEQVEKNYDNRKNRVLFPLTLLGTASTVFFILEYKAYKKRKTNAIGFRFQSDQLSLNYRF
ncbi:MAG: hypothetical protein RLN79_14080 [Cytophagales bacterium]